MNPKEIQFTPQYLKLTEGYTCVSEVTKESALSHCKNWPTSTLLYDQNNLWMIKKLKYISETILTLNS